MQLVQTKKNSKEWGENVTFRDVTHYVTFCAILFLLYENSKYNMESLYITGYPLHTV